MKAARSYTLYRSRKILRSSYRLFKKKGNSLNSHDRESFEEKLRKLDSACVSEDRAEADKLAREVERFTRSHFKKSPLEYFLKVAFALIVALAVAVIVRGSWFELYEIPTGSMRPTFKEKDHLTVSKTQFGINIPLTTDHFYFDPQDVKRTGVVIWSGTSIPGADVDTTYFGVLPYKKRYIKRLMGKPGDTLYFYGGKIYGIDKEGKPLDVYLNAPWLENLEYIPFMSFEGEISYPRQNEVEYHLMGMPIGRLSVSAFGDLTGEVFDGKKWVKDEPGKPNAGKISNYSDIWGMGNFAMARLLTKNEVELFSLGDLSSEKDAPLYLELRHHPGLTYPKPKLFSSNKGHSLFLSPFVSLIPLDENHLNAIMDNMYTARFVVKDEKAHRYGSPQTKDGIKFPTVPDGTYEFYHGKAYSVNSLGIVSELPKDHPLNKRTIQNIQRLYNLGIQMNQAFAPYTQNQVTFPNRYAYFRDGDLYSMGGIILKKNDKTLEAFIQKEENKEQKSSKFAPYKGFIDKGAPLKNGSIDVDYIKTYGLQIPDEKYMVLGDNHAMSADSRVFGFIPEKNLQGVPELIIWPPGKRLGKPAQADYPTFTNSRLIVWFTALLVFGIFTFFYRRSLKKPVFKKQDKSGEFAKK